MRARNTQVRGVPPAIVAPVGGTNPGDGSNRPSPAHTTRPRPSPCPPTGPGRIGGGGVPLRRPRLFLQHDREKRDSVFGPGSCSKARALRMTPDNSLDFAATRVQHTPMRLLIIED